MNRQDFEKWKEDESVNNFTATFSDNWRIKREGFKAGADAAYNLLSKEIETLKAKAEGNEIIASERGKAIEELQKEISEKDEEIGKWRKQLEINGRLDKQEIERLKGLLEAQVKSKVYYITGYLSEDHAWKQFKTENNL